MGVPLQTHTGKEIVAQAQCQVYAFHLPTAQQRHLKEQHLFAVAKVPENKPLVDKMGVTINTPAVLGIKKEIGGEWTQQSYLLGEGEIVKVWISRKPAWNAVPITACLLLQMRSTAALHKVSAKLLETARSRFKTADFVGRFDIISLKDALNKGCPVAPQYHHLFTEAMTGKAFKVECLEQEISARPAVREEAVQTATGEVRVFRCRERRRAVR